MCAVLKRSAVLAAAFVVLFSGAARASTMAVKVPFQFTVHGKMLPAGEYLLEDDGSGVVSIRGEQHNNTNMFVMTLPSGATQDPAGAKPALTFKRDETKTWRLAGIWESGTNGRAIVGG